MHTLNLGILAHVDAGKTSLTERLLYDAGVIASVGRVDDGDTRTDTLDLERQRGITIKSAVTAFRVRDTDVNLIDTPGHPDFIAEVERVLGVLDAVVLVVSAVEGVQAQTRILMRALQRLRLPVLIFVNKIDRMGARSEELVDEIGRRLRIRTVRLGRVADAGTSGARYLPYRMDDPVHRAALADVLTEVDDHLLADYLAADGELTAGRLTEELRRQTAGAELHPVIFGSAITGAGVPAVLAALDGLLPDRRPDPDATPAGTIFKIERDPGGEKICYLRMERGTLRVRDLVRSRRVGSDAEVPEPAKITGISVFEAAVEVARDRIPAGRIGKISGLAAARIGDRVGRVEPGSPADDQVQDDRKPGDQHFVPPSLETVVDPVDEADRGRLRVALDQLVEQDPLIDLQQGRDDRLSVSLYGEVQKQVIEATLAADFDLAVLFSESSTICVERPGGTGHAVEMMGDPDNPFLATVGLRVRPAPAGSGLAYDVATVVHGTMPPAFFGAVADTVADAARQALHGWQLTDCRVTLTHTGYAPRQSHAHQGFSKAMSSTGADFRDLTPLVLMAALRRAGTVVLEPIHRFSIELPAAQLPALFAALGRCRAVPGAPVLRGEVAVLSGDIPAEQVHGLEGLLPGLSGGEAVLDSAFDRYQPVRGRPPERARTDRNPIDRKEYLLRATRGLSGAR